MTIDNVDNENRRYMRQAPFVYGLLLKMANSQKGKFI